MRAALSLALLTLMLASCGQPVSTAAGDRTDGRTIKEPDATYLMRGRWSDFGIYEFTPKSDNSHLCILVRENSGNSLACFAKGLATRETPVQSPKP